MGFEPMNHKGTALEAVGFDRFPKDALKPEKKRREEQLLLDDHDSYSLYAFNLRTIRCFYIT